MPDLDEDKLKRRRVVKAEPDFTTNNLPELPMLIIIMLRYTIRFSNENLVCFNNYDVMSMLF